MIWKSIIPLSLSFLLFSCCNGATSGSRKVHFRMPVTLSVERSCEGKDYTYDERTGSCYKFHRRALTWLEAHDICVDEGGHLVIINSDQEALAVKELYAKHPETEIISPAYPNYASIGVYHSGVYHSGVGGSWLTVHGDTLAEAGYEKWYTSQPSNATQPEGEFCCVIMRETATISDSYCKQKAPFICEKAPELQIIEDSFSDKDIF